MFPSGFKRKKMVMDDLLWSEYKTTFCEPTNCMLNYIISKGYCLDFFIKSYFNYDQFKNYFSNGMEETYIGLKNKDNNQICYMSEIMFNKINLELEASFTQSEFDNALSRLLLLKHPETSSTVFMKRGIYLSGSLQVLNMVITNSEGLRQYIFNKHKGYMHCKLELVKIKNYYNEEFVSKKSEEPKEQITKVDVDNEEFVSKKSEEPKEQITKVDVDNEISKLKLSISSLVQESYLKYENMILENQELKSLIYGMLEEISELKEHNRSLSERIFSLENKPPVILV